MKISGNQSAIAEILTLLDKDFIHPFACCCPNGGEGTHYCICEFKSKRYEEIYGSTHYKYEVDYDGKKINSAKLIEKYSDNILNGCIR